MFNNLRISFKSVAFGVVFSKFNATITRK